MKIHAVATVEPFGTVMTKREWNIPPRPRLSFDSKSVELVIGDHNSRRGGGVVEEYRRVARVGRAVVVAVGLERHSVGLEAGVGLLRVGTFVAGVAKGIAVCISLIRIVEHGTVVAVVVDAVPVGVNLAGITLAITVAVCL